MFSITQILAAAAAITVGGTGTAALVMNAPPTTVDVAATMTAKANADLSAASDAQQRAIAALSSASAEGKAEARGHIEAGSAHLDKASAQMKEAVETGSKTAIDAFSDFSRRSILLVNSLATTASATANATVKASTDMVSAVNQQLVTARGMATAKGASAVQALTQAKAGLPAQVSAAVGSAPSSANVSAGANSSTSVSGLPVGVATSASGQLGVSVGQK